MTPSHDPHSFLIEIVIILQHMDAAGISVLDLESSIVNIPVHGFTVTCAASIFRRNNDITLSDQFSNNMCVVCAEIAMNTAMR